MNRLAFLDIYAQKMITSILGLLMGNISSAQTSSHLPLDPSARLKGRRSVKMQTAITNSLFEVNRRAIKMMKSVESIKIH